MQEPFDYVPVIWIIQEGVLGERLSLYKEMGWQHIITEWRKAFNRADIVVFPDSSLPVSMLPSFCHFSRWFKVFTW